MNVNKIIYDFARYILVDEQVERDLSALIVHLDLLALSTSHVKYQFDEKDYPKPPKENYLTVQKKVAHRFPDLDYYNSVADICDNVGMSTVLVSDAKDDLVKITINLELVIWRFQNTSENDALCYFEDSYKTHWGKNLRELQYYLHAYWW